MAEGDCADILCLNGHINGLVVASGTVVAHTKSGITVVAGTTGLTRLHFLHTNLVTIGFRSEGVRVAFVATEHFGVDSMTKDNIPDSAPDDDILGVSEITNMTTVAIFTDIKRSIAVVAGTAGLTVLHFLHANLIAVGLGFKYVWVTFVAAEHSGVNIVAKDNLSHRALHGNVHRTLVTATTVTFDTKCCITIVAGTAGLTSLHLLHTDLIAIGLGLEYARMAFVAAERFRVSVVAKNNLSYRALHGNIHRLLVTATTVAFDTKCCIIIVAGTARLTSFHLLHANLVTVGFRSEGVRVAFVATEHFGVDTMTESNVTDGTLDGDILGVIEITSMAIAAISTDIKRSIAVVAGTT
jgi:hypothetical protein